MPQKGVKNGNDKPNGFCLTFRLEYSILKSKELCRKGGFFMIKKLIGIVLSILLCPALFGAVGVSAEGKLADNVSWSVDGSTMTFTGSGEMDLTYTYLTEIPWYSYKDTIDTVIIGEGITSVGEGAFGGFRLLKNVTLPETMTTIGECAFLTCEGLETLSLPDRVTVIESGAFTGCEKLSSLSIPGNTYKIADDAFYNCLSLTIEGISGSYAEEFAATKGIAFSNTRTLPADIMVSLDHTLLWFDQPPVIVNDRTLVPLRVIFEALGATVDWEAETRTVTARRGNDAISLVIDTNVIVKNGEAIEIDVPAQIIGDRTMVPIRAVSETLGASVNWNAATRTVLIDD